MTSDSGSAERTAGFLRIAFFISDPTVIVRPWAAGLSAYHRPALGFRLRLPVADPLLNVRLPKPPGTAKAKSEDLAMLPKPVDCGVVAMQVSGNFGHCHHFRFSTRA
jgi:hypothetical protein